MTFSITRLISALLFGFGLGLALAGFLVPGAAEVKTTDKVKSVETEVKKENHKTTTTVTVKEPGGKETSTTTVVEDSSSNKQQSINSEIKKVDTKASTRYNVALLAGIDVKDDMKRVYGLSASTQLVGPVTIGAFGLTGGEVGFSLGVNF